MVDDIRRPDSDTDNSQNKQSNQDNNKSVEAPHLYDQDEGFVMTKATQKRNAPNIIRNWWSKTSKQERVLGVVLVAVILIGGPAGVFAYKSANKPKPKSVPAMVTQATAPPQPTTEASKLTGVQINPELNKRPVVSIQIENSPDARPQSGLKDAGVIFEAIAEGGITRFNASFLETQPDYIGPVRSVRPYYAVLAAPFDPVFVHAGGSGDGLAKLRELGLKDMDHGANGSAFRRVSQRYAPHNLYTSMGDLDAASVKRGYTSSNVKSFARKAEKPGQPITARGINLNMSAPLYNVHYDYDAATNSYKRVMAGKPHTDEKSGQQLSPKTVVALVMNYSQNGIYSVYQTTGSGRVFIFQDGGVLQGNWSKAGDKDQFVFTGDDGKPLELNAGQTWFTLVKNTTAVGYTP